MMASSMDAEELRYVTLEAIVDRLIPTDDDPGAVDAGVGQYIGNRLIGDLEPMLDRFHAGVDSIDAEAVKAFARPFLELSTEEKDLVLTEVEKAGGEPGKFLGWLARLSAEGFYADPDNGGNKDGASWKMIGYANTEVPRHPLEFKRPEVPPRDDYDAIVVGAGAAGGIVAGVLAEAGKHVLLLDRSHDLEDQDYRRDHLRNHRLSLYGHNTGPSLEGHPRVHVNADGVARTVGPIDDGYNNNAMVVGGGTLVYGGMAFRFLPDDFRMASRYGVPEGSSLADWPIGYDDLEPYYDRAEWEVGVSGDAVDPHAGPRRRGYPMPPVQSHPGRKQLAAGAAKLGWSTFPPPLLINSVAYNGRPECERNNACVGFPCPSNAKSGSQNTLLVRGLATGNLTLAAHAQATRVETDARGKVTGVSYVLESGSDVRRVTARARVVIVSAGAIESARLLLVSPSELEPQGLGNRFDMVGRNLQGHLYQTACGIMPEPVEDGRGPGLSLVTTEFSHGNPGVIGGGAMHDEFVLLPIYFWLWLLPPGTPRWGLANKRFMRECYRRTAYMSGPIQEIPSPESRVTADPEVRDRFGVPVARLSGTVHPESLRTADFHRERMVEWLEASGAERIWTWPRSDGRFLSASQHQAGTCRMGTDEKTSVTDPWGRVHGHDNLYVVDASLHVTNGGFNPVLTIMANAFRCAERIAKEL
jgi:choline dehydrogenase-like flavoprotein